MDNLVNDIKNIVAKQSKSVDEDDYLLMNSKYVPEKISESNFHEIYVSNKKHEYKALFVDGGNSILFESAEFCIGIIAVGGIYYAGNIRVKRSKEDFYIFVHEENGKFNVKTYPKTSFNDMLFDPEDESLRSGIERCNVGRIVSVIRRFAELEYAAKNCDESDFVVLDGTLEARYPYEEKYLDSLFSSGKTCALSKTCSLTTKNGFSITKKLLDMSRTLEQKKMNPRPWYYTPVVLNNNPKHHAEISFIKLHKKSTYVFRFEIQKEFKGKTEDLYSFLLLNSVDPIFFGYPYGLIDVDNYVRISDEETRLLQTKFSTKLGSQWIEFSKHLNSINAHSILDKIKF